MTVATIFESLVSPPLFLQNYLGSISIILVLKLWRKLPYADHYAYSQTGFPKQFFQLRSEITQISLFAGSGTGAATIFSS